MSLATVPEAVAALREGRPVIVVDDEARENEGDVVLSAELASPEWIAWTVAHSSGFICAPMPGELADRLRLPAMVARNEDPRGTAYTVTVDAADRNSTGISASDRAHTLRVLADPASTPASLMRPGHVLPLRAVAGGVLERAGHTEAAVDLMQLAGLRPVGAIAEIVGDDGEMMRLPALIALGAHQGIPVLTIADLAEYLRTEGRAPLAADPAGTAERPSEHHRVHFEVETRLPTRHGALRVRAYRDAASGADHIALIGGDLGPGALVRVHSECLTGEAFGSLKCECGPQLEAALERVAVEGGAVIYLRGHEGRGIGLINKLKAYRLQEDGLDTVDANTALGLPAEARDFTAAAAILADLGIDRVRLLTNNPEKVRQLTALGIEVSEQVPLVVGVGAVNEAYLETKRDRMGHLLPEALHPAAHGASEPTAGAAEARRTSIGTEIA